MQGGSVGDVLEDGAFEDGAVLETLGGEVGEVDCGVYADGCEGRCGVCSSGEFGFGEDAEIGDDVFEPGSWGNEFVEPLAGCSLGVFRSV